MSSQPPINKAPVRRSPIPSGPYDIGRTMPNVREVVSSRARLWCFLALLVAVVAVCAAGLLFAGATASTERAQVSAKRRVGYDGRANAAGRLMAEVQADKESANAYAAWLMSDMDMQGVLAAYVSCFSSPELNSAKVEAFNAFCEDGKLVVVADLAGSGQQAAQVAMSFSEAMKKRGWLLDKSSPGATLNGVKTRMEFKSVRQPQYATE